MGLLVDMLPHLNIVTLIKIMFKKFCSVKVTTSSILPFPDSDFRAGTHVIVRTVREDLC